MNNVLYITRTPFVDARFDSFANNQKLVTCYCDRAQRVLKNSHFVVSQKKKYIFVRALSDSDQKTLPAIYHYLSGTLT